jgi:uncharacterized repeat protein (TIGR01451 family)
MSKKFLIIGFMLFLTFLIPSIALAVGTPAGTIIKNGLSPESSEIEKPGELILFYDGCLPEGVTLNEEEIVQTEVIQGFGIKFNKIPEEGKAGIPGETIEYEYEIENISNGTDSIRFQIKKPEGKDNWIVKLFDKNNTEITDSVSLEADQKFGFLMKITIPKYTPNAETCEIELIVKNQNGDGSEDNWPEDGNDTISCKITTLVKAPVMKLKLNAMPDKLRPNELINYTLECINNGDAPALNVSIKNAIPEHTKYVNGSVRIDGQELEKDPYNEEKALLEIKIDKIEAGQTRVITYQVEVK